MGGSHSELILGSGLGVGECGVGGGWVAQEARLWRGLGWVWAGLPLMWGPGESMQDALRPRDPEERGAEINPSRVVKNNSSDTVNFVLEQIYGLN